jgi:hypothetical protein
MEEWNWYKSAHDRISQNKKSRIVTNIMLRLLRQDSCRRSRSEKEPRELSELKGFVHLSPRGYALQRIKSLFRFHQLGLDDFLNQQENKLSCVSLGQR